MIIMIMEKMKKINRTLSSEMNVSLVNWHIKKENHVVLVLKKCESNSSNLRC